MAINAWQFSVFFSPTTLCIKQRKSSAPLCVQPQLKTHWLLQYYLSNGHPLLVRLFYSLYNKGLHRVLVRIRKA